VSIADLKVFVHIGKKVDTRTEMIAEVNVANYKSRKYWFISLLLCK
jgi:hypothetical protein